jgi:DNA-binding response OmpR family regulator
MKEIKILLIEDDADDIELLAEAFRSNNIAFRMETIMEGDKVLPYMVAHKEVPDVIVLDFNLPKLHGREILPIIKNAEHYKNVPVVVLSTSALQDDVLFAKELGAAEYITKPVSLQEFNHTVRVIAEKATATQGQQ